MKKPLVVAVDDGYAQIKLIGSQPGDTLLEGNSVIAGGQTGRKRFLSNVRSGRHAIGDLSGDGAIACYLTEEGQQFTVSDLVAGESTRFDGYHTSQMNRVLITHALCESGYSGQRVTLWAALPVGDFFSGAVKNQAAIDAKVANLRKGVLLDGELPGNVLTGQRVSSASIAELVDVRVGCQAVSAFVDWFLDDDLVERDVPIDRVAVVDIGGRTTDIALILGGSSFDPGRSGTENIGALNVHESLSAMLQEKFRFKAPLGAARLDGALRQGSIRLFGHLHDISELVTRAIDEHMTELRQKITGYLGDGADIDAVLFVGGGAGLFRGIENMFPHGVIAEDPEFTNARGLYKYALKFGG